VVDAASLRAEGAIEPRIARRRAEEERAGTLLVCERRRSRRVPSAIRSERSEQLNPGSRAAVLRRSERARFWFASDDEVGGFRARSAVSGASN
jgi:hypothetical protein